MKAHILSMILALSIFSPMVPALVRSAPSQIKGTTQLGTILVDILDVNVSHNATYLGATISVHVTVEITWDVFDFSSGYVDALYDGNLIDRKIFYVIWQGHTIDYLDFDWNTSGIEMGSHSISAVAIGTNIDTYVDGTVQILPVGNLNTRVGYATIQEAINAANDGDTIFVRNGTYYENVVVNKTVTLVGENIESTILDANRTGTVVLLVADYVTIDGFTIRNSGLEYYAGIYLSYADYCHITQNDITNNLVGILLYGSTNNSIYQNNLKANSGNSISLTSSSNNIIIHNNFVNNTNQVYVDQSISNAWDNGCEGNYWSDYIGNDSNNDGIGDVPYIIDENNADNYPLMNIYWSPCDINHDLKVNLKDIGRSARAFGTVPGDILWNPHADITGMVPLVPDSTVDMRDIGLIARHFEEHCP